MTVAEMISMLEDYPQDADVVIAGCNTDYGEEPSFAYDGGVIAFWGDNYKAVVVKCSSQVGRVCDADEIDDDDDDECEEEDD